MTERVTRLAHAHHRVRETIDVLDHDTGHLARLALQIVILELEAAVFRGTHGGLALAWQRDNRVYAHQMVHGLLEVVGREILGEVAGLSVHGLVGGRGEVGAHESEVAMRVQNGHALAQEQVRVEHDVERVVTGRDVCHVYPLAVEAGVVVVAPAHRDALVVAVGVGRVEVD